MYTSAEAVQKMRQINEVMDYDAKGLPTETSLSFEKQSFETLPEVSRDSFVCLHCLTDHRQQSDQSAKPVDP